MEFDLHRIIVCGSGLAGLSAAITAQQAGAKVLLVEKAPEVGGSTRLSGGLLWTFADYEVARAKVPKGDAALQWLVYDSYDAGRAWLAECGVRVGPEELVLVHGKGGTLDPAEAVDILVRKFRALGGELLLDCGMQSLRMTVDGKVHGIRAVRGSHVEELPAQAVILATGGFQGNHELIERYVVPDASHLALRSNRWSTGDGLLAAMEQGAGVSAGLGTFYGHAVAASPARYTSAQLRDATQYYGSLSVALNMSGERFADETEETGEESLNQALARQPDGRGVYIVDDDAMEKRPIHGRPAITRSMFQRARGMGGKVFESPTLEALCVALGEVGIPAGRALRSLTEYNDCIRSGRPDELVPTRQKERKALDQPPFRAVLVQAAITLTMGGLLVDERARVLRRAASTSPSAAVPVDRAFADTGGEWTSIGSEYRQTPISGLFAAGNDVGNVSHFGYVGGLATALATGRVAGAEAAALVA